MRRKGGVSCPQKKTVSNWCRRTSPPATSPKPSKSWCRGSGGGTGARLCWASPAAARPLPWPTSSPSATAPPWCWPTTRPWPPSCAPSSGRFSRKMRWNTSSATTTTTSPRPISPAPTPTLKRTAPSTTRSTACAIRRRRLCLSGGTSSSWRRCPASTRWATPSTTAAWSSACGPACRWPGTSCAAGWWTCSTSATTSILSATSSGSGGTRWTSTWPI